MSFIDVLIKDHREAEHGLEAILKGETVNRDQLAEVLQEIQQHMAVEEKYLYPTAEDELTHKERSHLVEHSYKEHSEAKDYLIRLTNVDYVSDETLKKDVEALYEALKHHHSDEEEDVFPKIKQKFSADEMKDMDISISQFKEHAHGFVHQ